MREIKFRGQCVDTKEWVHGYYFMGFAGIPYILVLRDPILEVTQLYLEMSEFYEVIPETVGQFTGLTDKNGKKIFEGDIVKSITHFYGNQKERITVISFEEIENDSFGEPYTIGYAILGTEYEVIGNIYDNPNSIKEEK